MSLGDTVTIQRLPMLVPLKALVSAVPSMSKLPHTHHMYGDCPVTCLSPPGTLSLGSQTVFSESQLSCL